MTSRDAPRPRSRRRKGLVAVAVSAVLAVALPYYGTQTEPGRDRCQRSLPAGAETSVRAAEVAGWSWLPPGPRCSVTLDDGRQLEEVVPLWRSDASWTGEDVRSGATHEADGR